jgi:hypothetical protein
VLRAGWAGQIAAERRRLLVPHQRDQHPRQLCAVSWWPTRRLDNPLAGDPGPRRRLSGGLGLLHVAHLSMLGAVGEREEILSDSRAGRNPRVGVICAHGVEAARGVALVHDRLATEVAAAASDCRLDGCSLPSASSA